jgi:hypothetical protein
MQVFYDVIRCCWARELAAQQRSMTAQKTCIFRSVLLTTAQQNQTVYYQTAGLLAVTSYVFVKCHTNLLLMKLENTGLSQATPFNKVNAKQLFS